MNLEQYVRDATRTESRIDKVKVNRYFLLNALHIFYTSGSILDQIKKHVFYKKPYNDENLKTHAYEMELYTKHLQELVDEQYLSEETIDVDPRLFHVIVGLATESTELVQALTKSIIGGEELDGVNILEEFGDLNWYEAIGIDALNGDFENVLATNIDKLRERFPEKFTSDNAINRDVDKERALLEEKL